MIDYLESSKVAQIERCSLSQDVDFIKFTLLAIPSIDGAIDQLELSTIVG